MTDIPPIFSETSTATDPAEAAEQMQGSYGNVMVAAGPDNRFDMEITTCLVGGAVSHRIDTKSGAAFRFERQFDGYALVMLQDGGLDVSEGGKVQRWLPGACVVLDASRVDEWRWLGGRHDMLLVCASPACWTRR